MSKDLRIMMGLQQMIDYEFAIERSFVFKDKIKFFHTTTKKAIHYVEYAPFNKGNLWKIRKFLKYYHVYYGTQKKAYCTSLKSCMELINTN